MGNYQDRDNRGGGGFRGGNSGGRPPFPKKDWGGDKGGARDVVMHKATCSDCGNNCEVPFRPSGDKPVYCSNCFGAKKEGGDRAPRKDFGGQAPRRDFGGKPNARPEFKSAPANDDTKRQLSDIANKLDRLISLMEKTTPTKAKAVEEKTFEVKAAAPKKSIPKKKVAAKKKK